MDGDIEEEDVVVLTPPLVAAEKDAVAETTTLRTKKSDMQKKQKVAKLRSQMDGKELAELLHPEEAPYERVRVQENTNLLWGKRDGSHQLLGIKKGRFNDKDRNKNARCLVKTGEETVCDRELTWSGCSVTTRVRILNLKQGLLQLN
jgi:hypothetical protein